MVDGTALKTPKHSRAAIGRGRRNRKNTDAEENNVRNTGAKSIAQHSPVADRSTAQGSIDLQVISPTQGQSIKAARSG